ncbi:MAG: biopolymer transport protein TolR [Oleiphilaceae bacterium]|jgi:biopolymer transport protein TolR
MKLSRRAKRMKRHYKRMDQSGGLNLVSLMDIFTILVFFLMVNSSDVKVLQQDKSIELPISSAKEQPKENLVITISGNNVLVQGRTVASTLTINSDGLLAGLKEELEYQGKKMSSNREITDGYPATLVADKSTPYKVLKSIMATCTDANFTRISLAVSKKAGSEKIQSKDV